jgi:hypothetical protein
MVPDSKACQPADLDELAEARFGPLGVAEIKLLRAVIKGETAYCGPNERDGDPNNDPASADSWGPEREIRADLIRWLCIAGSARDRVDPRGIRVHAARITGRFDLSFVVVPFFLGILRCFFSEDLDLRLIEIPSISLIGSRFPSLNADHAIVKGSILLSGASCMGPVQLRVARIGGNLECEGAKFQNAAVAQVDESGMALRAEAIKVGGVVLLRNGFAAEGQVRLYGAEIGGSLECDGGKFKNPARANVKESGTALSAECAKVGRSVLLRKGFSAEGRVQLTGAEIGAMLVCDGGEFKNPAQAGVARSGMALYADSAKVAGGVYLCDGFAAEGAVQLAGAEIGGSLECGGGRFKNPAQAEVAESGMALYAENARVGGAVRFRSGFAA